MKLYGITGFGTGKLGNSVYSVRNGEQIVRQYNPVVANPQTDAQVASRSILKLMSQLATVLAPVINIPADGLKSKRNLFISQNYNLAYYAEGAAQIRMEDVQLTKSSVAFPSMQASREAGTGITVHLSSDAHLSYDKVVYVVVAKQSDGGLSLFSKKIVSEAGDNGQFSAILPYTSAPIAIYGYGIRANDADTLTRFNNLLADANMDVAAVRTRSRDLLANITFSITRGLVMAQGSDQGSADAGNANISVTVNPAGAGTVTGGGSYPLGSDVTIKATAGTGNTFIGWYVGNERVSGDLSYTFQAGSSRTYVAKFSVPNPGTTDDGMDVN